VLGTFVTELNAPIIEFTICAPEGESIVIPVHGIIDTGANRVCIPRRLATAASLRQGGTIDLKTASHTVPGFLFDAQLDFVCLGFSKRMQVVSPAVDRGDVPILIGMSVLRQFNIRYHGGMETWSFYRRDNA
jgi:predicted aspartyl protease